MPVVLAEGYRGISMVIDLTLDRVLVPLAICVALSGAGLIGVQLSQMLDAERAPAYQL